VKHACRWRNVCASRKAEELRGSIVLRWDFVACAPCCPRTKRERKGRLAILPPFPGVRERPCERLRRDLYGGNFSSCWHGICRRACHGRSQRIAEPPEKCFITEDRSYWTGSNSFCRSTYFAETSGAGRKSWPRSFWLITQAPRRGEVDGKLHFHSVCERWPSLEGRSTCNARV